MIESPNQQEARIRRLEFELQETRRELAAQSVLPGQTAADTGTPTAPTLAPIVNLIRNGDANHSVNSWFEDAPSGGNKDEEAANIYTHHAPPPAIQVYDGEIGVSTPTILQCDDSAPFAADDAGSRIVVAGVGADETDLATTIATYNSPTEVVLSDAATIEADAKNLTVRFRLQKIEKTNAKNSGSATTAAVKSAAHSNYATNINDPDWDKARGIIRLGSTNTIDCPFGYFKYIPGDGTGNGTEFIALHNLYPGRTVSARINLARANRYVKLKGQFFFGIWNNSDAYLDFTAGAPFSFTDASKTIGAASVTAQAQYQIHIETDQGYTIVSAILTLPESPDENYFSAADYNYLSWRAFAGALRYKIYRKLGDGNVFLLEDDSPSNTFEDHNPADRIDTGSDSFPNPPNVHPGVSAYVAIAASDLVDLPVDGAGDWTFLRVVIPFPSSINLSKISDPILRFGMTQPASLEVADASVNESATVNSFAGQFTNQMIGKSFVLTDPANSANNLTGTISAVNSPTEIVLSVAPGWTSTGNILEILDAAPRGVLIDLIGAAALAGEWAAHTEDTNGRPQIAVSNPNGSTQGGIIPGGGNNQTEGGGTVYYGHYPQIEPIV